MFDFIKIMISIVVSSIIAYLQPVFNPMMAILIIFFWDIVFGILVDILKNNERIRMRKLLISFAFLSLYFIIISTTYIIGFLQDDELEVLYIVKWLTYVFIYFYGSNCLRNLHLLAPNNKTIAFLDYVFGLEMLKKIPQLAAFQKKNEDVKETEKS